jgi:glycosyltransferase involved in cell wall biosynthesis
MRLLYLSTDPGVPVQGHKGASVHLRSAVDAFASLGASVVVASPRIEPEGDPLQTADELVRIDEVRPSTHASLRSLRRAMAAQAEQVAAAARQYGVDAIYERFALFTRAGVEAAGQLGMPHAIEVNAPLRDEAVRFRSLPYAQEAERAEADVFARADHVFAVSEPLAALLARQGVPRSKMTVTPNGVDPDKFTARQSQRHRAFTVGFAGSLKPWHGVGVLLEAFARALRAEPSLRLEIVGHGPGHAAVTAARLPVGSLSYHGALPHKATLEVISRWDAGIAPYLPIEGTDFYFSPLKVVEYMAAGICPVASDLGQIQLLLGNGERGILVEPGSAAALADAILGLAADRERAVTYGMRARAFALQSLTWQANARIALELLRTPVSAMASGA